MRHAILPHRRSVMLGILVVAATSLTITSLVGCADSGSAIAHDGGTPPPVPGVDGGDDTDADAGDAAARTCSDQGFCHVAVPAKETLRDVWGDGSTVWAVSEEGDVLRWDGQEWRIHTKKLGALYTIWGSGPTDIWLGGANGLFHGTGASSQAIVFEPVDAPGDPAIPILSIWGTGPADVFAVGGHISEEDFMPHGRVLRGAGAPGSPWELDPLSDEPFVFKRVWGGPAVGTWLVGDEGYEGSMTGAIYVRAPGTDDFAPVTIDASPPNGPDPSMPGGFVGGAVMADGRILVIGKTTAFTATFWYGALSSGGTMAWSYDVNRDERQVRAAWSIAGKDAWVAGDYGQLRGRSAASDEWVQASMMITDLPVIEPLYGIWGSAADDFWIVGRNTAIHRMSRKEP